MHSAGNMDFGERPHRIPLQGPGQILQGMIPGALVFVGAGRAVKGAELARIYAFISGLEMDVAVEVGFVSMLFHPHRIGPFAQPFQGRMLIQPEGVLIGKPLPLGSFGIDFPQKIRHNPPCGAGKNIKSRRACAQMHLFSVPWGLNQEILCLIRFQPATKEEER